MPIYLLSPLASEGTIHLPMIKFTLCKVKIDLSICDVLMFTSKQAVKSAEALNPAWKTIPCIAIGESTANVIKSLGGTVVQQTKTFYAKSVAEDIIEMFKGKKVLYLRPKEVSFDSKSFLAKSGIVLQEQVIYETSCLDYGIEYKPSKNAIIIFTSPSTIQCFLKNFSWDKSYIAIVIGEASKKHLPKNAKYKVADTPSVEACIAKAKEFYI